MKRILILVLVLSLLLCGCQKDTLHEHTTFLMDTVITLKLWGSDAEEQALSINALLEDLEKNWSATNPDSTLYKVNRGWENLSDYDQMILARAEALSERTHGAFNPYLGALSEAWGFYGGANQKPDFAIPSDAEIAEAVQEKQLDMGAALKGYAGGCAVTLLRSSNVDRALLNLGGNVQTYGSKADGTPWMVGIQNPDGGDSVGVVAVTGTMAVVTSGDYQRYFEQDGVRYHHILDPKTGYPANSGLRSVTVICADGMTADCLSTALFVMGLEEGIQLWRESDDFEAVFITTDGTIYATEFAYLSGCEYEEILK